jgi:hypothetical protein
MKPRIAVPLISAALTALVAAGLFANTRLNVAEAAAECMEATHDLRECSKPEGDLWGFVAIFAVVGGIVGAAGYSAGSKDTRRG